MSFKDINRFINSYSKHSVKFGPISIYKKVVELLGSTELADLFMLSEYGGYDVRSLESIKRRIIYNATRK